MNKVKKAAFSFEKFKISSFAFNEANDTQDGLGLFFDPHGKYNPEDGIFEMRLLFKAFEGDDHNDNNIVTADLIAIFEFEDRLPFEELPTYFYKNAIAIVFPYLRSFISTLTLQANAKLIKLPLLNLSDLEGKFKENSKSV